VSGILPRQRQRFSEGFFKRWFHSHPCTSRSPPGPGLRGEYVRMSVDEFLLLLWRELDHTEPATGVERCEDPIIDSEIRVAHMGAFDHTLKG
jgi:hypothetical protein